MTKVALVILNYNDNKDLMKLLPLIDKQTMNATIIIVDNDSEEKNKQEVDAWVRTKKSFFIGTKNDYYTNKFAKEKECYLVYNDWDAGFSGGNNVGLRVAHMLGMEYALLISPDVRIYDEKYIEIMLEEMKKNQNAVVAGSNVLDVEGVCQSPVRMISFKQEALWFLPYIFRNTKESNVIYLQTTTTLEHATIHGCCMLFNVEHINSLGYLDENVFMYCEEPILAQRIKMNGKQMLYIPSATAVHEHIRSKKTNSSLRMKEYFKSRKYYIKTYSDYSWIQKKIVFLSYALCEMLHNIKLVLKK